LLFAPQSEPHFTRVFCRFAQSAFLHFIPPQVIFGTDFVGFRLKNCAGKFPAE